MRSRYSRRIRKCIALQHKRRISDIRKGLFVHLLAAIVFLIIVTRYPRLSSSNSKPDSVASSQLNCTNTGAGADGPSTMSNFARSEPRPFSDVLCDKLSNFQLACLIVGFLVLLRQWLSQMISASNTAYHTGCGLP